MRIRLTMVVVLALVAAACGGDSATTTTTTSAAAPTTTAAGSDTTAASSETTTTAAETTTTTPMESPLSDRVSQLVDLPPGAPHAMTTFEGLVFSISVPESWTDREDQLWESGRGYYLLATPDEPAWYGTWEMEGVFVAITESMDETVDEWLDDVFSIASTDCQLIDRLDYSYRGLTGAFDLFDGCEGLQTAWITLAAIADDDSYFLYVEIVLRSLADVAYLDVLVESLEITGGLRP